MSALLTLVALHVPTGQVNDLHFDGDVLWAATEGGLLAWDAEGEPLGHVLGELPRAELLSVGELEGELVIGTAGSGAWRWATDLGRWEQVLATRGFPDGLVVAVLDDALVTGGGFVGRGGSGAIESAPASFGPVRASGPRLPGPIVDAVSWEGSVVAASIAGELLVWREGDLERFSLPAPAVDLAVGPDGVRIATQVGGARYDGTLHTVPWAVTAVSATGWGTASGEVRDDHGVIARLPGAVTALEEVDGSWFAATDEGLFHLDGAVRALREDTELCGAFAMGVGLWAGRPVVAGFDAGVCVLEEDGWRRIEGLPATVNDVLAEGDTLWVASSAGLFRVGLDGRSEQIGSKRTWDPVEKPGTNSPIVTGLAAGERLWLADTLGPVSRTLGGAWRLHRYAVPGTSYQSVAACGDEAWLASEDAGLSHFDGRRWRAHDASTGLPDDWIMDVACDGAGTAWAGTYQDGLWRWSDGRWTELAGLPDPWVLSVEWTPRALLVGTMGGLFTWDGATWQTVPGLPHPAVHDLFVEGQRVLVGTEGGVVEYRLR